VTLRSFKLVELPFLMDRNRPFEMAEDPFDGSWKEIAVG